MVRHFAWAAVFSALLCGNVPAGRADEPLRPVTLEGHKGRVTQMVFSPADPTLLATAGEDRTIRLWDVKAGKQLAVLNKEGRTDAVSGLLFSPDGRWLLANREAPTPSVSVWRLKDPGKPEQFDKLEDHLALGFSPDGKRLLSLSGGSVGKVYWWDVGEGFTKDNTMAGDAPFLPGFDVGTRRVTFSPDGSMFALHIDTRFGTTPFNTGAWSRGYGFGPAALGDIDKHKSAHVGVGNKPLEMGFFTATEPYCFLGDGRLLRWKLTKRGTVEETLPEATFGGAEEDFQAARLVPKTADQFVTVRLIKDADKAATHFEVARWVFDKNRGREAASADRIELLDAAARFLISPDCSRVAVAGKGGVEVYSVGGALGLAGKE